MTTLARKPGVFVCVALAFPGDLVIIARVKEHRLPMCEQRGKANSEKPEGIQIS